MQINYQRKEENQKYLDQKSTSLDPFKKVYLFGPPWSRAVGCTSLRCDTELILRPVKQLRMQNRKCLVATSMHLHKINC